MTVRIMSTETPGRHLLKIDGRLRAQDLEELDALCVRRGKALELDLSDLRGVDEAAVARLRRLRAAGVTLKGVSAYIALRLDGTGR